jgi:hypothetical protein
MGLAIEGCKAIATYIREVNNFLLIFHYSWLQFIYFVCCLHWTTCHWHVELLGCWLSFWNRCYWRIQRSLSVSVVNLRRWIPFAQFVLHLKPWLVWVKVKLMVYLRTRQGMQINDLNLSKDCWPNNGHQTAIKSIPGYGWMALVQCVAVHRNFLSLLEFLTEYV